MSRSEVLAPAYAKLQELKRDFKENGVTLKEKHPGLFDACVKRGLAQERTKGSRLSDFALLHIACFVFFANPFEKKNTNIKAYKEGMKALGLYNMSAQTLRKALSKLCASIPTLEQAAASTSRFPPRLHPKRTPLQALQVTEKLWNEYRTLDPASKRLYTRGEYIRNQLQAKGWCPRLWFYEGDEQTLYRWRQSHLGRTFTPKDFLMEKWVIYIKKVFTGFDPDRLSLYDVIMAVHTQEASLYVGQYIYGEYYWAFCVAFQAANGLTEAEMDKYYVTIKRAPGNRGRPKKKMKNLEGEQVSSEELSTEMVITNTTTTISCSPSPDVESEDLESELLRLVSGKGPRQ